MKNKYEYKYILTEAVVKLNYSIIFFTFYIFLLNYIDRPIVWDTFTISSILASVFGVAFILVLRTSVNYIAYYYGMLMSFFLAIQFYLLKYYDLTVLFALVYIPIQIRAIIVKKEHWLNAFLALGEFNIKETFQLKLGYRVLYFGLFIALFIAELSITIVLKMYLNDGLAAISSSTIVSATIIAIVLELQKKSNAKFYWLISSSAATLLSFKYMNSFVAILFTAIFINQIISVAKQITLTKTKQDIIK